LLLREGTVTELDTRPGILLALPMLLGVGYERLEMQMQPGDRLLFYTDGFYEINHPEQAAKGMLGGDELARLFGEVVKQNSDSLLPALLRRLREKEEPLEPKDDRTAVLLTLL
jgi:serine phosphatase RsbU (regulator of sigma subunit)